MDVDWAQFELYDPETNKLLLFWELSHPIVAGAVGNERKWSKTIIGAERKKREGERMEGKKSERPPKECSLRTFWLLISFF